MVSEIVLFNFGCSLPELGYKDNNESSSLRMFSVSIRDLQANRDVNYALIIK